jgi:hypothetical protein
MTSECGMWMSARHWLWTPIPRGAPNHRRGRGAVTHAWILEV